ncbi:hypothetical protein GGU10DRAFT_337218 [Lentinula aff. detonsa]|uniref:Uncharacterized protein n=1 Tax=Lentinula aff. detonsa TaxID=2804958 RepID=A0AA38KD84_9AGAR|nr:hypothetical protein GGU10DRAFT_337218 [Lentinula aff. detonsa]
MTVNHIDWFQDVESTYYSDSSEDIPELVPISPSQERSNPDSESLTRRDEPSSWQSDGVEPVNWGSEDCYNSDSYNSDADPENSASGKRVRSGPDSEWEDSRHVLEEIRYGCSPLVLYSIQNSIHMRTIFALPRERHRRETDEDRGRGLHNEMNVSHFGFLTDPLQRKFGDPLAEQLEYLLTKSSPYPSEDGNEYMAVDRFFCEHVLIDSAGNDNEYVLNERILQNPDFRPVEWFLREQGLTLEDHPGTKCGSMGDPRGKRNQRKGITS